MSLSKAVQFWRLLESIWRVIVQRWQELPGNRKTVKLYPPKQIFVLK